MKKSSYESFKRDVGKMLKNHEVKQVNGMSLSQANYGTKKDEAV